MRTDAERRAEARRLALAQGEGMQPVSSRPPKRTKDGLYASVGHVDDPGRAKWIRDVWAVDRGLRDMDDPSNDALRRGLVRCIIADVGKDTLVHFVVFTPADNLPPCESQGMFNQPLSIKADSLQALLQESERAAADPRLRVDSEVAARTTLAQNVGAWTDAMDGLSQTDRATRAKRADAEIGGIDRRRKGRTDQAVDQMYDALLDAVTKERGPRSLLPPPFMIIYGANISAGRGGKSNFSAAPLRASLTRGITNPVSQRPARPRRAPSSGLRRYPRQRAQHVARRLGRPASDGECDVP